MNEFFDKIDPDEMCVILNPTADDFSLDVTDIHHKGVTITYTVKARESLQLPRYAADNVSERLAQKMESRKTGVLTQAYHQKLLEQIRMYKVDEA